MQAYLNGDQDRDLDLSPGAPGAGETPDVVDVVIVGTGPAGMLLGAQLSRFGDITTRVLERRGQPLALGHADGLHPRTIEMFHAFGIDHLVAREGYQANEFTFWGPAPGGAGIAREARMPDMPAGTSEFPHIVLNQARVQDFLAERMRKSPRRLVPEYGIEVVSVERAADDLVAVHAIEHADDGPRAHTIRSRYVVGCDGARSTVRKSLGLTLEGDSQNHAWGVVDALVDTDFPDIRVKSSVTSPTGHVLVIPREGGYLVRLYVDMGEARAAPDRAGLEEIVATAQAVLAPYRLDVRHVQWWSLYEVGQRHTSRFDDIPDEMRGVRTPRIFIAGDACHTHSAKAGQGMNVSMADAFNLGWKLAAVLQGRSPASLLDTYSAERQPIAVELIEFDRFWARLASGIDADGHAVTTAERQAHQARRRRFMAGVATSYPASSIIGEGAAQPALAAGFPVGERFHSAPVVRLGDAKPMQLGHVHEADGRWRLYIFAGEGDAGAPGGPLADLCDWLAADPASPVVRHTPTGADIDAVLDVRAVLRETVDVPALPALLWPRKGRFALPDMEKAFVRDTAEGRDVYALRGIDLRDGAMVLVRPDQFVAEVLSLTDRAGLAAFFDGVLMEPSDHPTIASTV